MLESFSVAKYRFTLSLREQAELPKFKGSLLRGVLGYSLKQVCWPSCQHRDSCRCCPLNCACPYGYLFETSFRKQSHSNPSDGPRPYVIDPPLDGQTDYNAGEGFSFEVALVGRSIYYMPYLIAAFEGAEEIGLGKEWGRYTLKQVDAVHPIAEKVMPLQRTVDGWIAGDRNWDVCFPQICDVAERLPSHEIVLRFITPTCLSLSRRTQAFGRTKTGRLAEQPTFPVLLDNLLTRIALMYRVHCGQIWTDSREELHSAAEMIQSDCQTQWVQWTRTSTKQGRDIDYGGFLGQARYVGDLKPFMPFLLLGSLIHVGQKCDAGNGWYRIRFSSTGATISGL